MKALQIPVINELNLKEKFKKEQLVQRDKYLGILEIIQLYHNLFISQSPVSYLLHLSHQIKSPSL
jgi:hypothetical protein